MSDEFKPDEEPQDEQTQDFELQESSQERIDLETDAQVSPYDESLERRRAYYEDEAITFDDIKQHLGGPIVSLFFHIVVVIILATAISMEPPAKKEKEDVEVEVKDVEQEPPPEPEKPPEPPPEEQPQDFKEPVATEFVMTKTPMEHAQVQMEAPTNAVNSDVSTSNTDFANVDVDLSAMPVVETNNSALKLTGAFAARSASGRKIALSSFGGSMSSELAVEKALKWLVSVQNEDGSWGDMEDEYDQKVQLTCLALLAILAHGETPQSEDYGEALMRGLKKVMEWSKTNRHESGTDENGKIKYKPNDQYARSRILIVMAEGYAITKIPALENTMNREVAYFIKEQNPMGGFRYSWDHKKNVPVYFSDLDTGSRIYNALYSSYHAGCEHPQMKEAMHKAISAIKCHAYSKGGFSFDMQQKDEKTGKLLGRPEPGFEATGCGTLYLYLMGDNSNQAEKGYDWLCNYKPKNPSGKEGTNLKMDWHYLPSETPALGWYYMTQALFQGGAGKSKEWMRWNSSVLTNLTREQAPDGHWDCPADKYEHIEVKKVPVGKPDRNGGQKYKEEKVKKIYKESKLGGFTEFNSKLWVTVYFTLSLEVYYCYLPTFVDNKIKEKIEAANRDDSDREAKKPASKGGGSDAKDEAEKGESGAPADGEATTTEEEEDEISLD